MKYLKGLFLILSLSIVAACGGGGGGDTPSGTSRDNVGGGYTLLASGGTLNDGSGTSGLVVLATLRKDDGYGPEIPWTITITGPGITSPLIVDYDNGLPGSFMSWEWSDFTPSTGTYRITATNNTITLTYDFAINAGTGLSRPAPSAGTSGNQINLSWAAISGAGSYYYEVIAPDSEVISGFTTGTTASASFATLANGDYLVRVRSYATNRGAVDADRSSIPTLASQENVSEYSFTYPVGGDQVADNYSFNAALGVMDYGYSGPGGAKINGLAIWTSITASGGSAPTGDWNIRILDGTTEIANYIYPSGNKHYQYWYYGIEPANKTYTIEAVYGAAKLTKSFTLSSTTSALPLPTGISHGTEVGGKRISWNAVPGAGSYYINLWAEVWNSSTKQYEYQEVWKKWLAAPATYIIVPTGEIQAGVVHDVFVTASQIDMTATTPPSPSRADMSENYQAHSFTP